MPEDPSPESVVAQFIQAMNAWELQAWDLAQAARSTPDQASYWLEVQARVESVFAKHCTVRERPQGRHASFQRPPEYDPQREQITNAEQDGQRAYVETERKATIGSGTYRY